MKLCKKNYEVVAEGLVKELYDTISGRNEKILFGNKPSSVVMIGMIGGVDNNISSITGDYVDSNRFKSIPSIGLRFRVNKDTTGIKIRLKGKLFYRVIPTYGDQIRFLCDKYSKQTAKSIKSIEDLKQYYKELNEAGEVIPNEDIMFYYKSIKLDDLGEFDLKINEFQNNCVTLTNEINERLQLAIDKVREETVLIKSVSRKLDYYFDEANFERLIASSTTQCTPTWELDVCGKLYSTEKYNEIMLQLMNKTTKNPYDAYEVTIFDGGLKVYSSEFLPIEFDNVKYYYLDDPSTPAIGNNCSIIKNEDCLETVNMPIYRQYRVVTNDEFNRYIEFEKLIDDPIKNLTTLYNAMNKKLGQYKEQFANDSKYKDSRYLNEFEKEIEEFGCEITRFNDGINLITNKSIVRKSFVLMNKVLSKNGKYKGWRLFQIVFIVSELMDICNSEYEETPGFKCNDIDNVDLLYFPTGGGKTESFLGCALFAAFFDRLRDKDCGTTAIIKYPLRLLAAQQLDRILKLVVNANLILKEENIPGEELSVGFYTGGENTPNRMELKNVNELEQTEQETANSMYRQIDICPICGSPMNIEFDKESWRIKHVCSNPSCKYVPPIFIVDDEIYRYNPTFIISTIDKMANAGVSPGFKSILGQCFNKCEKHGFIYRGNRCSVPGCNCGIRSNVPKKDPIPTLFIQDELHLVNESLGTFDSHYESFIQYFCEKLVPKEYRKKIKYIGATATISDYATHIRGLYNKESKMFPVSVQRENFYSHTDYSDLSRIIIGAALYGDSITGNVQKLVTTMRLIVTKWFKDVDNKLLALKGIGFDGDKEDLERILYDYIIAIIYNNSKNDAGIIRAAIENQGNNLLISEGADQFSIAEITGDIEFKQIKNVMHEIEADVNKFNTKNLVMATSAISHGVDVDSFNQIYFYGMPNNTAEYIQAYSRVGRTHTGIVFDIIRLLRDRDKSYLKNFYSYHSYKDVLIDPVPINRYAKNAIHSTLPGILSALLLQHYVKDSHAIKVTSSIAKGGLTKDQLIEDMENIYDCKKIESRMYKQIIEEEVSQLFDAFKANTDSKILISDFIREKNMTHKGPMTSLRDVEVALNVEMKGN